MPHFSVSWDRVIVRLCPKWLEKLVNEDDQEDAALDVEMSLRFLEDSPLPPLPAELASSEIQGIRDLTLQEISAIEAMLNANGSASGSSEASVEAV